MLTWNFNKKPPWKNVQAVILAQRVCREWDWITRPFVIRVVLSGEGYEKLKGMKDTGGNSSVLQVAFTKHVLIYIFWKSWAIIYLLCSCIPVWVLWDRYNDFKYVAFFSLILVIQYSLEVVSFALRVLKFYLSKVLYWVILPQSGHLALTFVTLRQGTVEKMI